MQFKEGVDYNYVIPENESTTVGIKLLTGPFRDVVYQYGKVKFEEGANDDIYLGFIYNVIESPYEKDYLNEKFKNYIGNSKFFRELEKSKTVFGIFKLSWNSC